MGKRIVILHGFIKKTEQTPARALDAVRQRMQEVAIEKYGPVAFDPRAYADEARKHDPAFREAYDGLTDDQSAALAELLRARHRTGLTQAELADRMHTTQSTIARLESRVGSRCCQPQARAVPDDAAQVRRRLRAAAGDSLRAEGRAHRLTEQRY